MNAVRLCLFCALLLSAACSREEAIKEKLKSSCDLLTRERASAFLGKPAGDPQNRDFGSVSPGSDASVSNCLYSAKDDISFASISLLVRIPGEDEEPIGAFNRYAAGYEAQFGESSKLERIPNLGDGAGWDSSLRQLTVFKGASMMIFSANSAEQEETVKPRLEKLAKEIVDSI